MGIFAQLKANRLQLERLEFKNSDDVTEGSLLMQNEGASPADEDIEDIEIERAKLVAILMNTIKNEVDVIFNNSITALSETADAVQVAFKHGPSQVFDLVFGCDGAHSGVRQLWFGHELEYAHFLEHYYSLSIVDHSLITPNTAQLYNVPGKGIMLNAYNGKTDIVFWFYSEKEISYNYRDAGQQRQLILDQFAGQGWRTTELLEEVKQAEISYFDKFCQIKMPAWTKGRVALVGDAGYCASPAAGIGASLAMTGAAAVADALAKHPGDFNLAFQEYDHGLRPFIEECQATALAMLHNYFIPKTEEAILKRNTQPLPF
ncbi:hypothetical protein GCM10027345_01820 [Hymenobacter daeguensis]